MTETVDTPTASTGESGDVRERKVADYFGDVVKRRVDRRIFLKGAGAATVGLVLRPTSGIALDADIATRRRTQAIDPGSLIRFQPIAPSSLDAVEVPLNYASNVVIRWGDPLLPGAAAFDVNNQTGFRQSQQFGFNCDFLAHFPLPLWFERHVRFFGEPSPRALALLGTLFPSLSRSSQPSGLLWVNHEYTSGSEMFPGYDANNPTLDQVETEIQSHGGSVVGIRRIANGSWVYDQSSLFNRRITGTTPIRLAGPVAGHPYARTSEDPDGYTVLGMFNNCGGGVTPWGTVLSCEENFDQYFANFNSAPEDVKALSARIPAPGGASERKWEESDFRFDLSKEPNEYARFGYVVEIDPYDPSSTPVKHTALGRFKHEGAFPVLTEGGKAVVYSGDDARFEYLYKFVSEGTYNRRNRPANMRLLDDGTLYAAKLNDDGSGEWLPLVHGEGPLTAANGWESQAEVIVKTRAAADAVGATAMDRPEDVDVSPVTKKVYMSCTNNTNRNSGNVDPSNPRPTNRWGHVIEITEDGDNDALTFHWEILLLCGDPSAQGEFDGTTNPQGVFFGGYDVSQVSPIACPDNLDIDPAGNLWIATDGQPGTQFFGQNDGIFVCPVEGASRGHVRQFLSGVPGGEVASLKVSGDMRTLFSSIQHPGEGSGLPNAKSNWPDGDMPRPSVVAVRHVRGRMLGSP
jgi:secreted PhoX family phosphatase